MEGNGDGTRTIIGGDFNARTGEEGSRNGGRRRRRGGDGEKIEG